MGKKKQFIDKKKAKQFTVVHRSQHDPLQADAESGQHVLIPNPSADPDDERIKFGVYFDDDYDYLQHLRSRKDGEFVTDSCLEQIHENHKDDKISFGNIILPEQAFPSLYEDEEGMLSKGVLPRGPQPDWDPDIVAALDDDVDFDDPENFLEDDFIMKANIETAEDECETASRSDIGSDDVEGGSDIGSDDLYSDNNLSDFDDNDENEETKSRFTNYSMTSSVIRRTKGLKTLDDHFEKIMEQYDEDEMGCIEKEEITGTVGTNNEMLKKVVDEFIDTNRKHDLSEINMSDEEECDYSCDEDEAEVPDDELFSQFRKEEKCDKWDCDSIISTYSNIYNHPKIISEDNNKIKVHKITGIPIGVFNDKGKVKDDKISQDEMIILNNVRIKNESREDRKLRKLEVKNQRRNRREEKKNNKLAFKSEFKRQEKVNQNINSQKGIKL